MKAQRIAICILIVASTTGAFGQPDAQKSFDQLKSLVGTWEGKNSQGEPVQVSYRLTAGGSALMSEITGHGENMITMFHLDGANRLLMTHYCAAGNQPRMQASSSSDGKSISFNFVDGTNLDNSHRGHMDHVVFTIPDASHHTEDWNFVGDGKETRELFELQRAK